MYPDSVKNDRGNECFYQYYGDGGLEDYIDTSPIVGTKTGKIYEYQNYMKNTVNSGDLPIDERPMSYEESSTILSEYLPANGHIIDFNQNLSEEEAKAQWRELKEEKFMSTKII